QTFCVLAGSLQRGRQAFSVCSRNVYEDEQLLHLVRGSLVALQPIIPPARHLPGRYLEDYIPDPAAIVLITKRDQGFKVFLQIRGVIVDRFVLCVRIPFAVETPHSSEAPSSPYPSK